MKRKTQGKRTSKTGLWQISKYVFLSMILIFGLASIIITCGGGGDSGGGGEEPLPAVELAYTDDFEWVANTPPQFPFKNYTAIYRPVAPDGFHALGHYGQWQWEVDIFEILDTPCPWMFVARELEPGALAEPLDYELIGEPTSDCSFWKPIPPPGYVGLGFVAQAGSQKPDTDEIRCLREDLTAPGNLGKTISQVDGGYSVKQIVPEDEDGIYIRSFAYVAPDPPFDEFFCIHEESVQKEELSQEDVEELVEQYGPLLFFRSFIRPEDYFLDEPEYVLDHGVSLAWGVVYNASDPGPVRVEEQDSMPTSSETLLDDVRYVEENIKPYASDPELFKYWLHIEDDLKPGDLARAQALIRVLPWNGLFTEIQFWFFYPFNGPGRVRACSWSSCCTDNYLQQAGRHYGDWEHVSLLILNPTRELITVYMSRHDSGQWFRRCEGVWDSELQFLDTHPIIYSAYYSHAHYPSMGRHYYERVFEYDWGLGTASADLFDLTSAGVALETFRPDSYRVISSALPGYQVAEPEWLEFKGQWGQYENLADEFNIPGCGFEIPIPIYTYKDVGNGPTGPAMKTPWTDGDCLQIW